MNLLTENYNFIRQHDALAAEIYKDKKYYYLTLKEVSQLRGIPLSQVKYLYNHARNLIKNKDKVWLIGLSNRAQHALIENNFHNYNEIKKAVMNNDDIEALKNIGRKVALEIRGWVFNHS